MTEPIRGRYTPNFKWSIGDLDKLVADVRAGLGIFTIERQLRGTPLETSAIDLHKLVEAHRLNAPHANGRAAG